MPQHADRIDDHEVAQRSKTVLGRIELEPYFPRACEAGAREYPAGIDPFVFLR
jgi:hypothetical protein